MAIGMVAVAMTVGPLTRHGERVLSAVSIDRAIQPTTFADRMAPLTDRAPRWAARATPVAEPAPPAMTETKPPALRPSILASASVSKPQAEDRCNDFDYSFLHRKCTKDGTKHIVKKHPKHPERVHRVATVVLAHTESQTSTAPANAKKDATANGKKEVAAIEKKKEASKLSLNTKPTPGLLPHPARRTSAHNGSFGQEAPVQQPAQPRM